MPALFWIEYCLIETICLVLTKNLTVFFLLQPVKRKCFQPCGWIEILEETSKPDSYSYGMAQEQD